MLDIRKASAGSGKTYQLAYEYIRLALGYDDEEGHPHLYSENMRENHKKILAITFTNKATEEMKQRIVNQLYILSNGDSEYLEDLAKHFSVTKERIQKSAKKVIEELLNNFTDFNVCTIDSFFQIILRTFAREVEIGAEYGVELSDKDINTMGAMNLITSLGQSDSKSLKSWLSKFINSKIRNSKNWNIFQLSKNDYSTDTLNLFNIANQLSSEKFKRNKDKLLEYWKDPNKLENFAKKLPEIIDNCNKAQIDAARQIETLLNNEGYKVSDLGVSFKNKVTKLLTQDNKDFSCTKSFKNNLDISEKYFKKGVTLSSTVDIERLLSDIYKNFRKANTFAAMLDSVYQFGLLGSISQNIEKYREDNDVILLSDTNDLLKDIVGKSSTPFVYERIGMRIRNFLIDEFQDTSRMQYENIRPLLEESLGNNNFDLVIGDEKQSIYRFRNADPSLLQSQIAEDFGNMVIPKTPAISTNYRSDKNVILFNNSLFYALTQTNGTGLLGESSAKATYSNIIQKIRKNAPQGYVHVEFFKTDKEQEDEKWTKGAVEAAIAHIKDILSRGYRQSDIAIITNKHREGAVMINAILKDIPEEGQETLKVISDESLFLNNCSTINLIINILEYIDGSLTTNKDGEDDNINNVDIIQLLKNYHSFMSQGYSASEAISKAIAVRPTEKFEILESDYSKNTPGSIYNTVDYILKNFVTEESIKRDNPFIAAFQDLVLSYSSRNNPNIHSFLTWWKMSNTRSINSPDNIDAISVLTIHKSKGLEYPFVIIPFANWDLNKSDDLIWVNPEQTCKEFNINLDYPPIYPISSRDLAKSSHFDVEIKTVSNEALLDNLNKTYVAFTRARNELYIFGEEKEIGSSSRIDDCLWNALHSNFSPEDKELLIPLFMEEESAKFTLGEPIKKEDKAAKKEENMATEPMPIYDVENIVEDTDKPRFAYKIPELEDDPRHTGTLYHNLMSSIWYVDEIDFRVDQAVRKKWILASKAPETKETIKRYVSQDGVGVWFDRKNKIINERWLVNDKRENYRADRIVITPEGETIVIDYKFGLERLDNKYSRQVKNYMSILTKCGFQNIKGKIWYPELQAIVDVK